MGHLDTDSVTLASSIYLPLRDGEGWLSEESVDDYTRLDKSRVWAVDPLDGTREFVAGIPEFCASIAMVEDGRPVAGEFTIPRATNFSWVQLSPGSLTTEER